MANSYLRIIHTRKIITKNVIFIICTCQNIYNKKTYEFLIASGQKCS